MTLEIVGRLPSASNLTLVAREGDEQYVYKPVSGERPLWDFPDGNLAARERAAFVLSEALGWGLVPRTRVVDGPLGPGSLQDWVEGEVEAVDVVRPAGVAPGWLQVFTGVDETGAEVVLVHRDDEQLSRMAAFDVLANNADRKGGHLLTAADGRVMGIDHGVTFHHEPKLRTVLWGWVGEPVPEPLLADVAALIPGVRGTELAELLSTEEIDALIARAESLVTQGVYPPPSDEWPAIPWPVF